MITGPTEEPGARLAGHCVHCDRIIVRDSDGSCPDGHPPKAVFGTVSLGVDDPVPRLPRFNLAAFLIPPIWGPAHGQWAGAIMLPLWLFADSSLRVAGESAVAAVAAVPVVVATLAVMGWFAKRANGIAWRRVCDRMSVEEYVARERVWAYAALPISALLAGMALYFDLVLLPARVS